MNRFRAVFLVWAVGLGQLIGCHGPVAEPMSLRDLAGCWTVTAGVFKGSKVDSGMATLPVAVRLDTSRGLNVLGDSAGLRVTAVPANSPTQHQQGWYKMSGADSVVLTWSSGFTGLELRLATGSDEMKGTANLWTDYGGFQRAPIALGRIDCPTPATAPRPPVRGAGG